MMQAMRYNMTRENENIGIRSHWPIHIDLAPLQPSIKVSFLFFAENLHPKQE